MGESAERTAFEIEIPDFSLVVLVGVSGCGKSTFAARNFLPTEVFSSDGFRALVSDDENSLEATNDAFDALHYLAAIRLRRRKLVVIDATNVQPESRKPLLRLAAEHDVLPVAIVLDLPERLCQDRNVARPDRSFGPHVVRNQARSLRQSLKHLRNEGFRHVHVLRTVEEVDAVRIERRPLWTDRRTELGPFDIIGDVHGCIEELRELLEKLGYEETMDDGLETIAPDRPSSIVHRHPGGRRAVILGDLVDRGPGVVEVVRLVRAMVEAGTALCVPGNHDVKLMRWAQGRNVQVKHGLQDSVAQIEALPADEQAAFKRDYVKFVDGLVSHFLLDGGRLVVAHAGMKESYQGRASGRVRDFALYGDTTGETDEFGLPVRYPWAEDYRGQALVVYGHTPVPEADWLNHTINIDTGCVFGGKLTALRYPEREIVQVEAKQQYAVPARALTPQPPLSRTGEGEQSPFPSPVLGGGASDGGQPIPSPVLGGGARGGGDLLRAQDVIGKRIISTRLGGSVTVRAENAAAAFEIMSRFAVEPRWLIYLPPTMSPCETSKEPGFLEYPAEAFAYYRSQGVPAVVCQAKHMGSRAVLVVCRDEEAALRRFGTRGAIGECYTRTGRRFFDDAAMHTGLLTEAARSMEAAGLWDELETDWVCLDCELMPWSAKAQGLLREQYAPVAAAARLSLSAALDAVETLLAAPHASGLTQQAAPLHESLRSRQEDAARYAAAYGRYCWEVAGLHDLKLAPFHLLASEGRTYFNRDHEWHIATLGRLADSSSIFMRTESRLVDLADEASQAAATTWWREYTEVGGEGMVVKPCEFVARGPRGLTQPAVKVRGREYLRIIYGPEYSEPANLERLRQRSLGAKRSLAVREFALGVEGLERFVRREPHRLVHECAFGVLALESEPVDPRL